MINYQPWEDALILMRYQTDGASALVGLLPNRTAWSIKSRARRLRATKPPAENWTRKEDNIVRRCHPDLERAHALLPHRTKSAINGRSVTLGLGHQKPWKPSELELIRKLTPTHSDSELAAMLGRTATAVLRRRTKHHIARHVPAPVKVVPVIADLAAEARKRAVKLKPLTKALGCSVVHVRQTRAHISPSAIARVVEVFGGHLYAQWLD